MDTATVVQQSLAKICFKVDDVETAKDTLPLINAKSYLEQQCDRPLVAWRW